MPELQAFLKALPVVAQSALAFVAFLVVTIVWLLVAHRVRRNRNLLNALEKLPPAQRLKAYQAEMGHVPPPKGLTAQQWLKLQTRRLHVSAAIATLGTVALALLAAFATGYAGRPGKPPGTVDPSPPHTAPSPIVVPPTNTTVASVDPSPKSSTLGRPGPALACHEGEREVSYDATGRPAEYLPGINFDGGSCRLRPADRRTLANIAAAVHDWPDIRLRIQGYASGQEQGSVATTKSLSECRAGAAADYLVKLGVRDEQVHGVFGYGPSDPVDSNKTPEGRCRNQRVELVESDSEAH